MARKKAWLLIAAVSGGFVAGFDRPVLADDPQASAPQVITIRGKAMNVWPFEDLRARGFDVPEIPKDENAFWVYLDAVNAYQEVPADVQKAFDYALSTAWPTGHDEKLKEYLLSEDNQRALTLTRQAAARDQCQLYYFGDPRGSIMSVLLPSLSDFRFLGKLLAVDGRRLEEQGDYDLALQNYYTALRMGHHAGGGITLIENLVGVAIWSVGDRAVSQMVLRRDLSAAQLQGILDRLNDLAPSRPTTLTGIRYEKLFGLTMVDEVAAKPFQLIRSINSLSGGNPGYETDANGQQAGWAQLEARFGRLVMPDRTIKQHMTAYYDQLIERSGQPGYLARWAEFNDDQVILAIPNWDVIARMLLPSLSRASTLGERGRMQTLATHLSVALRLYALENGGQAPTRLDQLGDRAPAEDRIDPFSGREFVYDADGAAWSFYSISDNLVDDGGQEGAKPYDLDYVVRFPPAAIEPFVQEDEDTEPM